MPRGWKGQSEFPVGGVIGIDPSWRGFALCVGSSEDGKCFEVLAQHISTVPDDYVSHFHRLDYIGQRCMEFVEVHRPKIIAIEGYSRGSKQRREEAGELGGHIRWLLVKARIPFMDIPPTILKKFVTGKGNSPKEIMMQQTLKRWGYEASNNDICDAYGLMRLAWQYLQPTKTKSLQDLLRNSNVVGV